MLIGVWFTSEIDGTSSCTAATCAVKKQMTPMAAASTPAAASCRSRRPTARASAALLDDWPPYCRPCPLQTAGKVISLNVCMVGCQMICQTTHRMHGP